MKRLLLSLILITYYHLYAFDCLSATYPYNSHGDSKLEVVGNCSWLVDATAYNIKIAALYNGEFFTNLVKITGDTKDEQYINNLFSSIEKAIANSLYFTNLKYLDNDFLYTLDRLGYENKFNKIKSSKAQRTINISIVLNIYKYNNSSDLHYGLAKISVDPFVRQPYMYWYTDDEQRLNRYLYNKEITEVIPIVGFKNQYNVLIKNITKDIETYFSNSFKNIYHKVQSLTLTADDILIDGTTLKHFSKDDILGVQYYKRFNNGLKIDLDTSQVPILFLSGNKIKDEEIKQLLLEKYEELFFNLKKIDNKLYKEFEEKYINYYFPIIKKEAKHLKY